MYCCPKVRTSSLSLSGSGSASSDKEDADAVVWTDESAELDSRCEKCIYPVVVGVGGATRSGKTTLARSLHKSFPSWRYGSTSKARSDYISQDYFFGVRILF